MKKIVLIGTAHKYQMLGEGCQLEHALTFHRFLSEVRHQNDIKTVAEELNQEALEKAKKHWEDLKKCIEGYNKIGSGIKELEEKRKTTLKQIEESLNWHKKDMSVLQRVAEEKPSIKHLFCDPDSKECADRGIEREDWTKREQIWLERLRQEVPESEWPVLFICGASHVKGFFQLLKDNDFKVKRLSDHWNP